MKIEIKKLLFALCLPLMAISCAPQKNLYNWGGYQEASYQYMKSNTDKDLEKLLERYQYLIDNQKGGRMAVPPGIYADYGFLLVKQGKVEEGIKLMKMEVALYPESAVFVERIIKRIENQ
ncbi:MAG: DUF4810 domain-containing protein [Bacteroidales bacterium]|jgi:hypothetical protein|nr:DUF4810 domain-containing protein [Bacteroidales bacterium]